MRLFRRFTPILLVAAAAIGHAQVGTSITFFGNVSFSEGGFGTAYGEASESESGIAGNAVFSFSEGPLSELRLRRVTDYSVPGSTAFMGGPAIALARGARSQKVDGQVLIMVDDLSSSNLPFPDQIFIRFVSYDGRTTFIRHGLFIRGDVRVSF